MSYHLTKFSFHRLQFCAECPNALGLAANEYSIQTGFAILQVVIGDTGTGIPSVHVSVTLPPSELLYCLTLSFLYHSVVAVVNLGFPKEWPCLVLILCHVGIRKCGLSFLIIAAVLLVVHITFSVHFKPTPDSFNL